MKAKKHTKAQERKFQVEGLLIDALMSMEDLGTEQMLLNNFRELCDTYSCGQFSDYIVCKEDISPTAMIRLFKTPRIQSTLKSMLCSLAYNLRLGLKSKTRTSTR